jgi:hypothetical protein
MFEKVLSHPPNPGPPRRACPGRGLSEAHAATNKEQHVCARRRVGEPAVSSKPRRNIVTRPPQACQDKLFARERYVEALSDARTKLGKGRVLARLGIGGCNKAFWNILLAL